MAAKRGATKKNAGITVSRGWLWVIAVLFLMLVYRCGVSEGRSGSALLPSGSALTEVVAHA